MIHLYISCGSTLPPALRRKIYQVRFVLLIYGSLYSQSHEHGQLTRGHILKENWLFLSQQPSIVKSPLATHEIVPTSPLHGRFCLSFPGFVHAVTAAINLYVLLLCYVQKILVICSHPNPLSTHIFHNDP